MKYTSSVIPFMDEIKKCCYSSSLWNEQACYSTYLWNKQAILFKLFYEIYKQSSNYSQNVQALLFKWFMKNASSIVQVFHEMISFNNGCVHTG